MASSSRKRKGKDIVPQEEAEEGELLHGVLLPEPAKEHRSGPSQDISTRDQRLRENVEMRHAWFTWFTSEEDLDKCRKEFWTPGSEAGRQHFQGKLIELGLEAYIAAAMDANRVGFSTSVLDVHERLAIFVRSVPGHFVEQYETWLKSPQFDEWTLAREKRPYSFRSGDVYLVGAVDPELADQIGRFDVVFYAKSYTCIPWWNGGQIYDWIEREFELRWKRSPNGQRREPVADDIAKYDAYTHLSVEIFRKQRLEMAATLLQGLAFMHTHNWLHCDLHLANIFVHFPLWDWDDRVDKQHERHDNFPNADLPAINKKLVFVGVRDLGWAQREGDTGKHVHAYPAHVKNPREWVAPELTHVMAKKDRTGKKYVTKFSQSTDIFAMGYILQRLCGDYFSDMTPKEEAAYDQEKFAKGFPSGTSLPHVAHRMRLREALEQMTAADIANRHDYRMTARYWVTYFQDQLMIDPLVCQRPLESKPRAKKHPDDPREIGKDKL
ncbi:hypothetical protein R1sor_000373 [Riccia sorocarpa]|uniref:Protein kinase domain-containing protein n=1 Tax=Riccia sorocarpa TaxID=122646 RepID=A0ABD3GUW9_9MARC